jgi:MerR family transcriptional regulator, copper efflux regulator
MSSTGSGDPLYPIDEVARRLQLRPSAIRYYEDRGLIEATARRGGKRCFDADQVRRLTVIQLWKREGLLSLDSIASFLDKPNDPQSWKHAVDEQINALTHRIDQLQTAREYLVHIRNHHDTSTPDGCPHYEEQIDMLGRGQRGSVEPRDPCY